MHVAGGGATPSTDVLPRRPRRASAELQIINEGSAAGVDALMVSRFWTPEVRGLGAVLLQLGHTPTTKGLLLLHPQDARAAAAAK